MTRLVDEILSAVCFCRVQVWAASKDMPGAFHLHLSSSSPVTRRVAFTIPHGANNHSTELQSSPKQTLSCLCIRVGPQYPQIATGSREVGRPDAGGSKYRSDKNFPEDNHQATPRCPSHETNEEEMIGESGMAISRSRRAPD